ncbi:MAG: hypothetical protein LBW85_10610 [Deltaproteobacteria bacterium]|jgi:hypothetical protein|nr:hypothetical protein [Deltaproteobacteria bacterium]
MTVFSEALEPDMEIGVQAMPALMKPELAGPNRFWTNRIFSGNVFDAIGESIPGDALTGDELRSCRRLLDKAFLVAEPSEQQVTSQLVAPLMEMLGWHCLMEHTLTVSSVQRRPDMLLFTSAGRMREFSGSRDPEYGLVGAVMEIKAPSQRLDNGKVTGDNPYNQLLAYLQATRIDYGFLTNGRSWMFIDNTRVSPEKRFVTFDLRLIANFHQEGEAGAAFEAFWRIFNAATYAAGKEKPKAIDVALAREDDRRARLEDDLKSVIYGQKGEYSLFEDIGRVIHASALALKRAMLMDEVLENSLRLLFRLAFVSYFEDRHRDALARHPAYSDVSLGRTVEIMRSRGPVGWGDRCFLWKRLRALFAALDEGDEIAGVTLLNGGLFSPEKSPLLDEPRLMKDKDVSRLLGRLLYAADGSRRDFRTLSPSHLGTIYHGLAEYEFRTAEEDLEFLRVSYAKSRQAAPQVMEGFCGRRDKAILERLGAGTETVSVVGKGQLYLQNAFRNRRLSCSYYTPGPLSAHMAKAGIQSQLDSVFARPGRSILDMKILDNACGSGQILIDALNFLADKARQRLGTDTRLRRALEKEAASIREGLAAILGPDDGSGLAGTVIEERDVLKRILLKRTIYGVDVSQLAVELALVSLWVDTFVLGAPLVFIEHHVKRGNALVGAGADEARSRETWPELSLPSQQALFDRLQEESAALSDIYDSSGDQVKLSKSLYRRLSGEMSEINKYLDIRNFLDIVDAYDRARLWRRVYDADSLTVTQSCGRMEASLDDISGALVAYSRTRSLMMDPDWCYSRFGDMIGRFGRIYAFFNWETEFPDAFRGPWPGFNVIIGNPPSKKTSFEENHFFAGFMPFYDELPEPEKRRLREEVLSDKSNMSRLGMQEASARVLNEYIRRKYPHSKSGGSGALFRPFIERSLGLLAERGCLVYLVPTSLLTDDMSKDMRLHILNGFSIVRFDGFANRKSLFPDVTGHYRFGMIQIEKRADPDQSMRARFNLRSPDLLDSDAGVFSYPVSAVRRLSPEFLAYMEIPDGERQLPVLDRMYSSFRPLDPRWLDFRNDFEPLVFKEISRKEPGEGLIPVCRGESIYLYRARYREPARWVDPSEFRRIHERKNVSRLLRDVAIQFRSDVSLEAPYLSYRSRAGRGGTLGGFLSGERGLGDLARFAVMDHDFMRLCFRAIAGRGNERTAVAAVVPAGVATHQTLWASVPGRYRYSPELRAVEHDMIPPERLFFALGILNSIPFDWALRFSVDVHASKSIVSRIPFPQPEDAAIAAPGPCRDLARNAALLTLSHSPGFFPDAAGLFGIDGGGLLGQTRAEALQARNDAVAALIYGLNVRDLEIMLEGFRCLNARKPEYAEEVLRCARELLPA